ncbi:MAG: hypothetical protein ACREO3_02915 [Arenimonas sp.]
MRRISFLLPGMLLLATVLGCDRAPTAAAPAPAASSTQKPQAAAPPAPSRDESAARAAALAAGPGTCEEDVVALRVLPMQGQLGLDRHFDRMAVHPQAYAACLVAMVRDRTAIEDLGDAPKRSAYDRGDLAYDVLQRINLVETGACIPGDVVRQAETTGAHVVSDWLEDKNHRRQAHRCLLKALGL